MAYSNLLDCVLYLVDVSAKVAKAFAEAVKTTYRDILSPASVKALVPPGKMPQKQGKLLVSPEGLNIRLIEEGVQNAEVSVHQCAVLSHGLYLLS